MLGSMSTDAEILATAPCPSPGRQFLVMFALYGGVQAALGGAALSWYGARWALVGIAVGLGSGVLFAALMLLFTRYAARRLSRTDLDFHVQHLGHLGLRETDAPGDWRVFEGRGLRSVASRVFLRHDTDAGWIVAPRAYLTRARKIAASLQD